MDLLNGSDQFRIRGITSRQSPVIDGKDRPLILHKDIVLDCVIRTAGDPDP